MISLRIFVFFLIFISWFWANSIFAPWATSMDPRLWLYDLLFYTRFVLMFWAAFELIYACMQIRNSPGNRQYAIVNLAVISLAAITVSAYLLLMYTGSGFRARVELSSKSLDALRKPEFANLRQRAGWFLVDTQRQPCGDQPWLWLGNMYGGGTGNNLALVHSGKEVPLSPAPEAFRFWPVSDGWWLAYQNPKNYYARALQSEACDPGEVVASHDQGMKFIVETPKNTTTRTRK